MVVGRTVRISSKRSVPKTGRSLFFFSRAAVKRKRALNLAFSRRTFRHILPYLTRGFDSLHPLH